MTIWRKLFRSRHNVFPSDEYSLESIPGVGAKTAKILRNAGFVTVSSIRNAEPDNMSGKTDLSVNIATNIIEGARSMHISVAESNYYSNDILALPYDFASWCSSKGHLTRLFVFVIALTLSILSGFGFIHCFYYGWIIDPPEVARRNIEYVQKASQEEKDWRNNNPLIVELRTELSTRTLRHQCIFCGSFAQYVVQMKLKLGLTGISASPPEFFACDNHAEGIRFLIGPLPSWGDVSDTKRQRLTREVDHRRRQFYQYFKTNYVGRFCRYDLPRRYDDVFGRPWEVSQPIFDSWDGLRRVGSILLGIVALACAITMVISAACLIFPRFMRRAGMINLTQTG